MKRKKIKILMGILILSIFLFATPIKSSNLDIEKVELTTTFQGIKTSQVEIFHDDINTFYWNLVDVSNPYFEKPQSQHHNYLLDNYTNGGVWNYTGVSYYIGDQDIFPEGFSWDGTNWWMIGSNSDKVHKYYSNWSYTGISYDIVGQCSTPTGIFWDGTNWWLVGDGACDTVYKYDSNWNYTGSSYYIHEEEPAPKGIFWDGTNWWMLGLNNKAVYKYDSDWSYTGIYHNIGGEEGYPSDLFWDGVNWWVPGIYTDSVHQYDSDWSYTGISYYLGGLDDYPTDIFCDGINWWMLGYENSRVYEYGADIYKISKNYFGNGYMYMQTNTTETIALQSVDYDAHYNLSSGYYFKVEFETNSDSQIDLILLKDGIINDTLTLSQSGNINFLKHTVQISIDKDLEFDQLKISGTLEDTDYIKIYNIKIERLGIVGEQLNINIIAIVIGAILLALGVSLAIISVIKVKSIKSVKGGKLFKSVKKKRKIKAPTLIAQKEVVQEIPAPKKPIEIRRLSLKEFEKLPIETLIDQRNLHQEMEIPKQRKIDGTKREMDKGKIISFIGGIIGLLAVFTPASYTVISIYGITILSWYIWMFGFHYYNDIVEGTDIFLTGDSLLLQIQLMTTGVVIAFNIIVLIKAAKFRTPTSKHSFFSARSAIALFLAMIFYMLVFEIWGQLSVDTSFWAVQSIGFGIFGQFLASGFMVVGHFLSKKYSRYIAPLESALDQEELYKTSDKFLDNNVEIIRLHEKGINVLEKKVEFLISKQGESEILEKVDYKKALEYFQKAVELSPDKPINYSKINLNLANKIIGEAEDKKRALVWLDEIKENTERLRRETLWYLS